MAGEWEETTLADVSADVAYGYTESASDEKVGPRFLRITDIQNGVVDWHTVPYCPISESDHQKYRLHSGDIVVARTGNSTGENYLYRGIEDAVYASYLIRFRVNQRTADPAFVWYNMRTQRWQDFINSSKTGSAQAGANAKVLGLFPLPLPPLAEQKAIAAVLGALDDKIELNRRMNATLEAMARVLFQSWFVDFDPVRAKIDGRQPAGLDPATAALFPDSFQDSELGHIPKRWRVGRVAEVSDFSRSSINPAEFPEETFDHYSLPAFDEGRTPKAEPGSAIMSNKLVVTRNSVLLSKLNPHIPRIWLPDLDETRRSVCSTEFIVASTRSGFSSEFIFSLFTSAAFATTYGTLVTGTTGSHQRIKPESVLEMKTVIPPQKLVEVFTAIAKPMFDQINRNTYESRTLATLRDTLLPKLLSGEIRLTGGQS
jgi:type I restriction enzyme S subunit